MGSSTFFLDSDKGMLPHLEYAQAIPGRCQGRGIGLIDTHVLTPLADAVAMLEAGRAAPREISQGLREWVDQYRHWFVTSSHGIEECDTRNNHGTYYDLQLASFALFTGHEAQAREALVRAATQRLPAQIETDGSQPHELARTLSYNYSCMNLGGFLQLARIARRVGVDMTSARSAAGKLLRKACDWFEPVLDDVPGRWSCEQIKPPDPQLLARLLYVAAATLEEPRYVAWSQRTGPLPPDARVRLQYRVAGAG